MKRIASFLLTALILANLSTIAYSETDEMYECFSRKRLGLLVEIRVTALAWPGENITITIKAAASEANINLRYIHVNVSSLKENRSETLLSSIAFLEETHLSLGEANETSYEVPVPEDTLPGLLYGKVEYKLSVEGDEDVETEFDVFPATYIQNKPYEDLKEDYDVLMNLYDALETNYTSLEANYTDLQGKYQELVDTQTSQDNTTSLMYIFLATTVIFVITTILLLVKRPKAATW